MSSDVTTPMVSIIVPTHRRVTLLGRLLRSLQAQEWPSDRFEILVVHNYTDDGTDRLVADIAAASAVPIRYHRVAFNSPGPSRQFGADRAAGSVLAFIDDDCEATPGWIRAGVAAFQAGAGLVQGRTLPHPGQPRRLLERTISVTGPTPYFETCNIFYDATAFRSIGGIPVEFRDCFGAEDTALGWSTKRAGYRTAFAGDALVYHEVFAVSFRAWLFEPWKLRHWPWIARAYPEVRRHLFLGVFLSPLTAAFDLAVVGLLVALAWHPAGLVLVLPYVGVRMIDRGRFRAPHILLARLVFGLPRAFVMLGILLQGSLRARSLVL